MSKKRPDGYYWVRELGEKDWEPKLSRDGAIIIFTTPFSDKNFAEIGPPCNRDDAEQLRLAREVLRKVLATEMDAIAAWAIKDAFDKSGVRL